MNLENVLTFTERLRLVTALRSIQVKVRWKPGKEVAHLSKRQTMGHLPGSASLADYEATILGLVREPQNAVYLYEFGNDQYYAVRGTSGDREWLVIFGPDGLMGTAFPPEEVDEYLERRGFILLAGVEEVLKWTDGES